MKARLAVRRWNSVGRASVAVAGVCLTGSVASAWTATRAADFETEFEDGQALGTASAVAVADEAPAVNAVARVIAADSGSTVWEQTLVSYLDKLVARDCDGAGKDGVKHAEIAGAASQDADELLEVIVAATPAAEAAEPKADANPDWDLEESAIAVAGIDPDWDLAEPPVAAAAIDPDWDLAEPAVAVADAGGEITAEPAAAVDADWDLEDGPVAVAEVNADWDLEEPAAIAVAASTDPDWDLNEGPALVVVNVDWDLEEPATDDAVTATARDASEAAPKPAPEANADWDLEEPSVAAAPAEEVGTVESSEDLLDLFP